MDPLILHLSELRQYCCRPPPSTPFFHFLCFLLLNFLPPPPGHPHSNLAPPLPPPAPPRCCLKSILSLFLPLDKTERVQGVIRQSSRGGMALVRLLSLAHKHTVRHRATEVRPLEGWGAISVCVLCVEEGILCVHGGRGERRGHPPFSRLQQTVLDICFA